MSHSCELSDCSINAKHLCGKCRCVRYCSREHQVLDWKKHKVNCFPIRTEKNADLGRYMVATRDIKAGELLLSELPLITGPLSHTTPICLGCMGPVDGKFTCPVCKWPLCSDYCPTYTSHHIECELFHTKKLTPTILHFYVPNPLYECIMPIRCLGMRDKYPEIWTKLSSLQSNIEERKEFSSYKKTKNVIIHLIRQFYKFNQFSEDEIHMVSGILETNGYEIPNLKAVSLYNKASLFEHSCVSNTNIHFGNSCRILVTATVDIKKDEHITVCYIDPLMSERMRKSQLLAIKYFKCQCPRCQDPTDFETHLSTLRCETCKEGFLLPPPNYEDDYICLKCGIKKDPVDIEERLVKEHKKMTDLPMDIYHHEKFLKENKKWLHETHYLRSLAKMQLLTMLGQCIESLKSLSMDELNKKIQLGEESLKWADKISPGLSRLRGFILHELQRSYIEKYCRLVNKSHLAEEVKLIKTKIKNYITQAVLIYKMDIYNEKSISSAKTMETILQDIENNSPITTPQRSPEKLE